MKDRVRAVLVTPNDEILLIRRECSHTPVYWVLPGGGVESTDASREDALRREVHEELAGIPEIHGLLQMVPGTVDRQFVYLARITNWSFRDRTGPEFNQAGRGAYHLDAVPLTMAALEAINLKPDAVADLLLATLSDHGDLFASTHHG